MHTSQGEITIRPADTQDAAHLRELRLEALANQPEAFAADLERSAAEAVERWEQRIAEQDEQGVICVAEAEGKLIGMTGLGRGHWNKTQHSAVIWGVYVNPAWRGLRVADAMIEECIAWGQGHGVTVVKLGVNTRNIPAIRCYLRIGFSIYGVEPQAIYYHDIYHDEFLLSRQI